MGPLATIQRHKWRVVLRSAPPYMIVASIRTMSVAELVVVLRHVPRKRNISAGESNAVTVHPESDLGSPLGIVGRNHAAYRAALFLADGGALVAGSGNRPPRCHAGQD